MDVNTNNIGPADETRGNFKDDVQENLKPIDKKINQIKHEVLDKSITDDFDKAVQVELERREMKGITIGEEEFFKDVTGVDPNEKIQEMRQQIFGKIKDGTGLKKDFSSLELSENEIHSNDVNAESDVSKDV